MFQLLEADLCSVTKAENETGKVKSKKIEPCPSGLRQQTSLEHRHYNLLENENQSERFSRRSLHFLGKLRT